MKNEQNARNLLDICPKNTFFPNFGAVPGFKAQSDRLDPNTYRSTAAIYIVLNKLFMRLRMLLYSVSLDV